MRIAAITAALVTATSPAAGSIALPKDNCRIAYRDDAARFKTEWPLPSLITGEVPSSKKLTDFSLHSDEARGQYPLLTSILYPLKLELVFEGGPVCKFCRDWWWVSYAASSLYLIGLWIGTSWMKDKEAWDLKTVLAIWNLFLAIFSFIGMIRTAPQLYMMIHSYGFEYTVCRAALAGYGSGASGLWVAFFIFSKYAELLDTVFLVLRKRKIGFLHWYHHCTVLLMCWHAYVWEMPTGIYWIVMNYSVHAVMYFYYFLAAVCKRPPRWALLVTILQLLQMAIGICITLSHVVMLVYDTVPGCDGHIPNLTAALGMYASYFILFAQFLCGRYCGRHQNGHQNGHHSKKHEKKLR